MFITPIYKSINPINQRLRHLDLNFSVIKIKVKNREKLFFRFSLTLEFRIIIVIIPMDRPILFYHLPIEQ